MLRTTEAQGQDWLVALRVGCGVGASGFSTLASKYFHRVAIKIEPGASNIWKQKYGNRYFLIEKVLLLSGWDFLRVLCPDKRRGANPPKPLVAPPSANPKSKARLFWYTREHYAPNLRVSCHRRVCFCPEACHHGDRPIRLQVDCRSTHIAKRCGGGLRPGNRHAQARQLSNLPLDCAGSRRLTPSTHQRHARRITPLVARRQTSGLSAFPRKRLQTRAAADLSPRHGRRRRSPSDSITEGRRYACLVSNWTLYCFHFHQPAKGFGRHAGRRQIRRAHH